MPEVPAPIGGNQPHTQGAAPPKAEAAAGSGTGQTPPPPLLPSALHPLGSFPVAALILLHFFTCGIFPVIWLNLMHGKLPRVRSDDPSAARAVGFCFIPFFNLYWIFFTYRRLCLRLAEQRDLYGLPSGDLRGMATTACIFQVIPYVNLLGYLIVSPIFIGQLQSSVNQLVKKSETTPPKAVLPTLPAAPAMPGWAIALVICACLLGPVAVLAGLLLPALAKAKQKAQRINCVNNLKQAGLAFRIWASDNNNRFPFEVSTNKGGTRELCLPGQWGLDRNSWLHFQVLSNELATPRLLACPADTTRQAAVDFGHLGKDNVCYLVFSSTASESNPNAMLALCPVHNNVLFCDGSVAQMSERRMKDRLEENAHPK